MRPRSIAITVSGQRRYRSDCKVGEGTVARVADGTGIGIFTRGDENAEIDVENKYDVVSWLNHANE